MHSHQIAFSLLLVLLFSVLLAHGKDEGLFEKRNVDSDFFLRSAKWAQFPSGGSLVSGRGGFRPGFSGRSFHQLLYEPSFKK